MAGAIGGPSKRSRSGPSFLVAFVTISVVAVAWLYITVTEASAFKASVRNAQEMREYISAANECERKWPLADAFEVHSCAIEILD